MRVRLLFLPILLAACEPGRLPTLPPFVPPEGVWEVTFADGNPLPANEPGPVYVRFCRATGDDLRSWYPWNRDYTGSYVIPPPRADQHEGWSSPRPTADQCDRDSTAQGTVTSGAFLEVRLDAVDHGGGIQLHGHAVPFSGRYTGTWRSNQYHAGEGKFTLHRASIAPEQLGGIAASQIFDWQRVYQARVDEAERRWQERGPASYRLTYYTCAMLCPVDTTQVTVRRGRVVAVRRHNGRPFGLTVPDLFGMARDGYADWNVSTRASFDSVLGYPRSVVLERRKMFDSSHGYVIIALETLSD